jgi:hypothetical protein
MQEQFEKLLHKQRPWNKKSKHSAWECYNLILMTHQGDYERLLGQRMIKEYTCLFSKE